MDSNSSNDSNIQMIQIVKIVKTIQMIQGHVQANGPLNGKCNFGHFCRIQF